MNKSLKNLKGDAIFVSLFSNIVKIKVVIKCRLFHNFIENNSNVFKDDGPHNQKSLWDLMQEQGEFFKIEPLK